MSGRRKTSRQTSLPDGEFFTLSDDRDGEMHLLTGRLIRFPGTDDGPAHDQHDRDPDRSRELSMARLQRLRELNPDRNPTQTSPTLFDDRRHRFDPALLSDISYFYGSPPQCPVHFDALQDYAREPLISRSGDLRKIAGGYAIVSAEWKDAIESLEKGVHEFFPHEIEFCNYNMYDHFIFRDSTQFDLIDYERSNQETAVE